MRRWYSLLKLVMAVVAQMMVSQVFTLYSIMSLFRRIEGTCCLHI